MTVTIRPGIATDALELTRLIIALATYEKEPNAVEVTADILATQLNSPRPPFESFVADAGDGRLVGFALFFSSYSTWRGQSGLYLEDLFVESSHRRRGVGRLLMDQLLTVGRQRGCKRLEWSVLDWNQLAIDFYRGLGAEPMTGWTTWRLNLG
ncbi:MAG: GNAT family N-acetyltransferase [Myxococcales bacterium]|nr:GNAT family N-acetyltransferase [Myxococcales bacterium]|tara:strand:- start:60 stop:518 length:459 start_codon:yes stop_codon:yes gene_type:complete